MAVGKSEEERSKLIQAVERMKEEEYFEKAQCIKEFVTEDTDLVFEVKDYTTKLQYMDQYLEIINTSLLEWRKNIQKHIQFEKAYSRVLEKEPYPLSKESLSHENMTPEILKKIVLEIIQMNREKI